jgi:hypothetical protein
LLIFVTFQVALSKCPRCGNYFHMHGMSLLILRKCLHCQLHISTAPPVDTGVACSASKTTLSTQL